LQAVVVAFQGDFILLWQFVELVFAQQGAFSFQQVAGWGDLLLLGHDRRCGFGHTGIIPDKRGGDRIQTLSLTYHHFVQEKVRFSLRYELNIEERGNRIANDRVIVAAQYRF